MSPARRFRRFLPETVLAAGTLALLLVGRGRWVTTISDPGIWYSDLESLSHGGRLMDAVRVPYGPLSVVILQFVCRVFAYRIVAVAGTTFAFGVATLFLLLKFSARFLREGERLVLSGLAVGYLLWLPGKAALIYPYAPAVPIGLTLVLLCLKLRVEGLRLRSWRLVAASGAAAGLAYLTKQEMGVAAAGGLIATSLPWIRVGGETRRLFLGVLSFFVTVVAGYAWWFRGLPFWRAARHNLLWPFASIPKAWTPQYAGIAGYDQPMHSVWLMLQACALLFAVASGVSLGWALLQRERRLAPAAVTILFVSLTVVLLVPVRGGSLLAAAPVVAVASLLAAFNASGARRIVRSRRAALIALSAACLPLLYRVGLRGWADSPFAGLGYTLVLPLFVWVVAESALRPYRGRPAQARRLLRTAAPIAAVIAVSAGVPRLSRQSGWPTAVCAVEFARGTVYAPPPWATALERAASAVGAEKSLAGPVLFLPETHGLDFLLDRRSAAAANKLDVSLRGELEEDLLSRLRSDPPAVVLWFHEDHWPFGTEGFGSSYGVRLREWVESRYAPALQSAEGVSFTLYRPRAESAALPPNGGNLKPPAEPSAANVVGSLRGDRAAPGR